MRWSTLLSIPALLTLASLLSCAPKKPVEIPLCANYWTIAPANLIVELAAGNEVILDPAYADFPLFCNAFAAQRALRDRKGEWAVFRIAENDAERVELRENQLYLALPSVLADWESEQHSKNPKPH